MRFVHSLWSSPSLNNRWDFSKETATIGNIWYYALSVAYIKRLGQEIVLHTDSFGKECLDHIPYDEIYLTLDEKISPDTCPIMWACSKFYALDIEPLGAIHIDGDVFIKSQKCLDIINAEPCDMFCQGEEDISFITCRKTTELYKDNSDWISHLDFPEGVKKHGIRAYNTGVLAFYNQDLKNRFIKSYFFMLEQVLKDEFLINKWKENRDICPDLVIEQRFIHDLSQDFNVRTLIDYYRLKIHEDACEIGFQHVLSKQKYKMIDICKKTLKKVDYNLYLLTEDKVKIITEKYFQ